MKQHAALLALVGLMGCTAPTETIRYVDREPNGTSKDKGANPDGKGGTDGNGNGNGNDPGSPAGESPVATGPTFGMLAANPQRRASDKAAGLDWAMVEMGWGEYEPARGQFDDARIPAQIIRDYKAAGFRTEVSFGFHNDSPAWANAIEPWKDQNGKTYPETPNWFNPSVQAAVANTIKHVVNAIGAQYIDAIRIGGLADAGEINYPMSAPYKYLGYSQSALQGSALIPANPVPQCKPPTCSKADAATFYRWYVAALTKFGDFQVKTLRDMGFKNDVMWLLAGGGVDAELKGVMLDTALYPVQQFPNDYGTASGGQDWPVLLSLIADKGPRTVISETGINDSTTDTAKDGGTDIAQWSAPKWVAHNALANGFKRLSCENVGQTDAGFDNKARMDIAFRKMKELGYEKLMWAWDDRLYTPGNASINDYAAAIATAKK